jgi:DNA-binding SARP family transcriptional activator/streptogramin lyase
VGGARQRALLAALLIRPNAVVSSDRLIDELWGETPPDTASTALHGYVSQLRKVLEPGRAAGAPAEVLVTRAPGYVLRVDPSAIDAARFEQLVQEGRNALAAGDPGRAAQRLSDALGLWRGDALAGVDDTATTHAEARRLDELRLEALEDRIDADLARGHGDALVPELEALVQREPLRERPRGQLMLALYRAGRQAEALELYQDTRRRFVDELGIEPTPRLRELEQAILAQDPELDAGLPRWRPRRPGLTRRPRRLALGITALGALAVAAALAAGVLVARDGVASAGAEPGTVVVVDAKTRRVADRVQVGAGPVAIVAGHGSVWVANSEDGTVSRIDPETHGIVATVGVPSPVDLAVGPDAVWVASGTDGTISRIDAESNHVVAAIDLNDDDPFDPQTVHGIAAGAGGVWVATTASDLVRIDPEENRVTRSIEVPGDPIAVTSGLGAMWAVTSTGRLLRFDPGSGAVTASLPVGSPGAFPTDVVATDDGVLVVVGDTWVVDPRSTRLERTLDAGGFTHGVADIPGPGFWAVTFDGELVRFADPDLSTPPTRVRLAPGTVAAAPARGKVWVAVAEEEY